jgi:hypothetical protein
MWWWSMVVVEVEVVGGAKIAKQEMRRIAL